MQLMPRSAATPSRLWLRASAAWGPTWRSQKVRRHTALPPGWAPQRVGVSEEPSEAIGVGYGDTGLRGRDQETEGRSQVWRVELGRESRDIERGATGGWFAGWSSPRKVDRELRYS